MVTAKVNAPSVQAYDPTQLETALATAWANPHNPSPGSTGALLASYGLDRQRGIEAYQDALGQSNALQVALARQEMDADLLKESLAKGADYAKAGIDPNEIPLIARIYANANASSGADRAAALQRTLIQADIAHKRAQAAAAGQGGADTSEIRHDFNPDGTPAGYTVIEKTKGGGARVIDATAAAQERRKIYANPGGPLYRGPSTGGTNTYGGPAGSKTMFQNNQ